MEQQNDIKLMMFFSMLFGAIVLFVVSIFLYSFLKILTFIFILMGVILLIVGWVFGLKPVYKINNNKKLLHTGKKIETKFIGVEENKKETVRVTMAHRMSPFIIKSSGTDPITGETKIFKSNNVWFDPRDFLSKDEKINVYVDPKNSNNYYMDLSFLDEKKEKLLKE